MHAEAKLLQIVLALRTASGFAGLLNGGQQKGNQDCNDRDHNQ
jgi:hypothetical protein